MQTDIDQIKQHLRAGFILRNRGEGWALEPQNKPPHWLMAHALRVPADLVALLSAQGHIKTELRLVGSAQWVQS